MRLVTFEMSDGGQHIGAITNDEITISDFTSTGNPQFHDMLALIDGGDAALEEARYLTENPKATIDAVPGITPLERQCVCCGTALKLLCEG